MNYAERKRLPLSDAGIGERVIVRSNEDEPFWVGELVGFEEITRARHLAPIVRQNDGKEFVCLSTLYPYSAALEKCLNTMSPKEQWAFVLKITKMIRVHTKLHDLNHAEEA